MEPFWKTLALEDMTPAQWESLCDGCGRCCLHKLENRKTGRVYFTSVACRLLDLHSCRCKVYARRRRYMPDCLVLTPTSVHRRRWLPRSCAYRLLVEGKDLPWWHPLVSGSLETVHKAGMYVRGKAVSEEEVDLDRLEDYIVT